MKVMTNLRGLVEQLIRSSYDCSCKVWWLKSRASKHLSNYMETEPVWWSRQHKQSWIRIVTGAAFCQQTKRNYNLFIIVHKRTRNNDHQRLRRSVKWKVIRFHTCFLAYYAPIKAGDGLRCCWSVAHSWTWPRASSQYHNIFYLLTQFRGICGFYGEKKGIIKWVSISNSIG